MPLSHRNTHVFHRTLYAGMLITITLLKRGDDQQEGSVTSYLVFQVRRSRIFKTGEPLLGSMLSDHHAIFHIPRIEMNRIGIDHIMPADRLVDEVGRIWQPESTTTIVNQLFENHLSIECLRIK